jgi:hypothetical protein
MPYSSFTIAQVKRQFHIEVVTESFFSNVPILTPGEWLTTLLAKSAPLAVTLGTEKVRSELIIAPLLFEFRELLVGVASPWRIVRSVFSQVQISVSI